MKEGLTLPELGILRQLAKSRLHLDRVTENQADTLLDVRDRGLAYQDDRDVFRITPLGLDAIAKRGIK